MTAFALKLIAIIAMTVDHIAYTFFPDILWLRIFGRITIVIMAYFITVGYRKTRNVTRYMLRLLAFAVISEIPFHLLFGNPDKIIFIQDSSNVIFTLFLGVAALWLSDIAEKKNRDLGFIRIIVYAAAIAVAVVIRSDWQYKGLLIVFAFYHAGQDRAKMILYPGTVYFMCFIADIIRFYLRDYWISGSLPSQGLGIPLVELCGVFALPLILCYNGKKGTSAKYLFYIYYPLHLTLIWLARTFVF